MDHGDAVDFNVKMARPCGNTNEDPGGRVFGKITGVNFVDRRKLLDGRAIHVTLQDIFQRRSRRFQAKLHLL